MGLGYLKIQVYEYEQAKPISNVRVSIRDDEDRLIKYVFTDLDGVSDKIELYAPNKELSLEEFAKELPYAKYNLFISFFFK